MRKCDIVKKIMESNRINETDQAYYINLVITGNYNLNNIKWIWE